MSLHVSFFHKVSGTKFSLRYLPLGYSFDRYGLIVHCQFGYSSGASPVVSN